MADDDLEVGLVVRDQQFATALKDAEKTVDRTGKRMKEAGEGGAKAFDKAAFSFGKVATGLRAGWELMGKLTRQSELWAESQMAVDKWLGAGVDKFIDMLRVLGGSEFWDAQERAKAQAAAVAREMADPLVTMKIRLRSLRDELTALREDEGDVLRTVAQDLSVGEGSELTSAIEQAIAKQKRRLYDESVTLEAFVKAFERNRDLTEGTVSAVMSSIPDIIEKERETAEQRLELEEKIAETRVGFIEAESKRIAELEAKARKQSWAGFQDGIAAAIEDMKDLESVGRDVALGLQQAFASSFFAAFKSGTFDAKKLLSSLLDLAMNVLSNLAGGQATSLFGSIFGGFKAAGGPVTAGRSYVVGEKGPEVFRPDRNGVIEPASAAPMGGGLTIPIAITIHQQGGSASGNPEANARSLSRVIRNELINLVEHDSRFREAIQGRRG